jgi:hypothetical protein
MKKTIVIIAAALAVLAGVVLASDRLRVIAVDGDSSPLYSTAKTVSLTPAVTATQTVAGLTQIVSNKSQIASNVLKAATTQVALTMHKSNMVFLAITAVNTTGAVTLAVVTNVTVSTVWGFASTTATVATNEEIQAVITNIVVGTLVTNATIGTTDGGQGFSGAQAGAILTNSWLFHKMLQDY